MHEKGIARYIVQAGEWDRIMEGLVIGVVKGDMVDRYNNSFIVVVVNCGIKLVVVSSTTSTPTFFSQYSSIITLIRTPNSSTCLLQFLNTLHSQITH